MDSTTRGRHSPADRELLGNFVRPLRERIDRNCNEPSEKDTTMKTTKKNTGIKVAAGVKGGSLTPNHVRSGLNVKAGIKAGFYICKHNHSARLLTVG